VARALQLRGDTAGARQVAARVEAVVHAARLDSVFGQALPTPGEAADSPRATLMPQR
jgi:hypothetical protein